MKNSIAMLLFAAALPAVAANITPETPLVEDGPVTVDVRDVEAYLLRVPEAKRGEVRASQERIASIVDNVYVTRKAAGLARDAALDKDPAVQRRLQQVQESALAELYLEKLQKGMPTPDLRQRAWEMYISEPQNYQVPERLHLQQILVSNKWRTREMARERAEKAYKEATQGGKDFLAVSAQFTDDREHNGNGGDLGIANPKSLIGPVADAAAKLKKKGDISEPFETEYGYHVIRLVERMPAEAIKFDAVSAKIIAAERERLVKDGLEKWGQQVRSSPSVVIHRDAVQSLSGTVDPARVNQAQEKAK